MLETKTILIVSFSYMGLLFGIAYYARRQADSGRSLISNPYIYTLSMAVYCTAWTFYGSVGRAAETGIGFLPTYIGPTLTASLGWIVLRKIIRISKIQRITSIADFIASRYGKSAILGVAVTIIAVVGVLPYIALQLKAISVTFLIINNYPFIDIPLHFADVPVFKDTGFYVALLLILFTVLFGTRRLDATERHEGLVTAIAFESLIKLIAFLAVGIFVTYGIFNGFGDIIQKAETHPKLNQLFVMNHQTNAYTNWTISVFLSMTAVIFLPRQFQVTVVENVNEEHLNKAMWLFPLYLLIINIFVLPVAFGGVLYFVNENIDADTFLLTIPMAEQQSSLALLVYIGGISAATSTVIVETVALSTMICNDLVMPVLLRLPSLQLNRQNDLSHLLLTIRRGSIALLLLMAYAYFRFIGEFYALVSIGLVSFAAVAQFAPAILGGIFWKGGTKAGALSGLIAGFIIWAYTLVFPSLVYIGLFSQQIITEGLFGIEIFKPFQLFGLQGFDQISHTVFWSLLINFSLYIGVSLFSVATAIEHTQASLFVDVFKVGSNLRLDVGSSLRLDVGSSLRLEPATGTSFWRGTASVNDLQSLLARFLGKEQINEALTEYGKKHKLFSQESWDQTLPADPGLVSYAETLLAGVIGSASARVMVASVTKEEPLGIDEVMNILDETCQVIAYSHELEKVTAELKTANERLKELDKLKDEFISTVTHELRTPLTSVRSLAEILHDHPDLDPERHKHFTSIIIKESERLTRLISQVLDFQKIESGKTEWQISPVNLRDIIHDAVTVNSQLLNEKNIKTELNLPDMVPLIPGDRDRLIQVMVNLISNAVKFCNDNGIITVSMKIEHEYLRVSVMDNGIGISTENQKIIFEKFRQVRDASRGRPAGSGLGLTITKQIIEFHKGDIWVESEPGKGSTFSFRLPLGE